MKNGKFKTYLKQYAFGLDVWGLLLFAVIMLPNIIAFCVPAISSHFQENTPLDPAASVFQVISVALLIFIVRREREKIKFSSPLIVLAGLALICYYIAWIFLFCSYLNAAVWLFLAIMPCAALICFEIARKNIFALPFTVVFAILHIISTCIAYL